MDFAETMEQVARGVEVVGIATLVLGLVVALVQAARVLIGGQEAEEAYRVVRIVFGRSILLGWSSWWPPTSYEPSPWNPLSKTSVSWG